MSTQPVLRVVSQHAESGSFLWLQRARAVSAPHYSLADLAKLDNRAEANLDGLRIARERGWEICKEALNIGEPGEVFAAAVLAFETGQPDRIEAVLDTVSKSPGLFSAVVSALGWLRFAQAEPHIQRLLASTSAALQLIGLGATAVHRHNPGAPLRDAITSADSLLKTRALRTIGELGLDSLYREAAHHLTDGDDLCRFWAAWAIALLSPDRSAVPVLVEAAESNAPYRERAIQLAIGRMDEAHVGAWVDKLEQDLKLVRSAITAAGIFGDPARIPWLIDQMHVPEFARVSGEAFTMITGVDLAYQDLETDKPKGFEAGPTENPEDENVEMDPDENLPWPDAELIGRWWRQHQSEFQNGTRYLLGKPISIDWCQHVLRAGRQRQRAAAALELAIRQPGQPLFNVAAPGFRQQQMLGIKK